jgi:putative ABC transport system ATP-binding protein
LDRGILLAETASLSYRYGDDAPLALRNVSVTLRAGEIVMLLGPSASGKTTLLSLIGTLRRSAPGQVRLFGIDVGSAGDDQITRIRRRLRLIFQKHYLLRSLTVLQNVMVGAIAADNAHRAFRSDATEILKSVGLGDQVEKWPDQLSAGQQQRVAVARALAGRPDILLADEPTASLDRESALVVADSIRRFADQRRCAVLVATHDDRITGIATRYIRLNEGAIIA